MKKGDLSKFVEEAVRRRILNRAVQDIKTRHADPGQLQALLDDAVAKVREERRTKAKGPDEDGDRRTRQTFSWGELKNPSREISKVMGHLTIFLQAPRAWTGSRCFSVGSALMDLPAFCSASRKS